MTMMTIMTKWPSDQYDQHHQDDQDDQDDLVAGIFLRVALYVSKRIPPTFKVILFSPSCIITDCLETVSHKFLSNSFKLGLLGSAFHIFQFSLTRLVCWSSFGCFWQSRGYEVTLAVSLTFAHNCLSLSLIDHPLVRVIYWLAIISSTKLAILYSLCVEWPDLVQ